MPRRTTPPEPPAVADPQPAPGSTPDAAPGAAPGQPGFFGWLRRLGILRRPGWLGGVCEGIAERLGVDPVLVRGVVVVIAVLGGPAALLYALAWFLLPDGSGTIHADELRRGRVSRALPGIAAIFLLSFLPLAQGFWFAGAFYWGDPGVGGVVLRVLWTAALLVALVVAVVWLARRAGTEVTTAPATTDDRPETVPTFPADAAEVPGAASTVAGPGEPTPPPVDASAEELVAWRAGQDEWQRQRSAWIAEQRRTEQERRRAEAHARAAVALEAGRERARRNRLLRPRASAGVVALVLGVALVAAAVAAVLAQRSAPTRGAEWIVGASVLTLVVAVGIVAVALARRRSGILSLLGILAVLALALAVVVPTDRQVLPVGGGYGLDRGVDGRYAQLAGSTYVRVLDRGNDLDVPVVDLWQFAGSVYVELDEGAAVRIETTTDADGQGVLVNEMFGDGSRRAASYTVRDGRLEMTVGGGEPDLVLRGWIGRGVGFTVEVTSPTGQPVPLSPEPDVVGEWTPEGNPAPSPTPTPSISEGAAP